MEVVLQAVADNMPQVACAIAAAGVAAALCFQRPEKAYAGKVVFGVLCALLAAVVCTAFGVFEFPPVWAEFLPVLLAGAFLGRSGWRRTVLSLGCWAFVTYMLWMCLRVLPCDASALAFAQGRLLPAAALPCVLALLLSAKSPVRFWSAFFGVFLVLYLMEAAGMAWVHFVPHSMLPGAARLVREYVLGAAELALMLAMFLCVLQAPRKRAFFVIALYALRTAYVLYGLYALQP